jgi:DNA-binding transcriptional ArsR family regulator
MVGAMAERREQSVRTITDSKALAAMAHPLRRRLLDVLKVDGPSTASMLAERTGQAVANVSHHVRVLADASLVQEAPELARDRRERWWRTASETFRWSGTSFADDPSGDAIASAAESLGLEHQAAKVRDWYAQRETAEREWLDAAFSADSWLRLTSDELAQLCEEIVAVFGRWKERAASDDGVERRSVFVFAHGVPAEP